MYSWRTKKRRNDGKKERKKERKKGGSGKKRRNIVNGIRLEMDRNVCLIIHNNIHVSVCMCVFTNPSARTEYDTRSIFKQCWVGFDSEFSFSKTFCQTNIKEFSLSYYLPKTGGSIIGFIPFPKVFMHSRLNVLLIQSYVFLPQKNFQLWVK